MNYCAEMNSFYNWVLLNPIPADAQALWCALMNINNKCAIQVDSKWYWRVEFTVPNSALSSILQFSRTQLDRMRNVLIQSGRISYRKGKGNQSGKYKIIPFDTQYVAQFVTQSVTQTDTQTGHKVSENRVAIWVLCNNMCTLNNNIISNNNFNNYCVGDDENTMYNARAREGVNKVDIVDNCIGITPELETELRTLSEKFFMRFFRRNPMPEDMIWVWNKVREEFNGKQYISADKVEILEYAFQEALKANVLNVKYINGIYANLFCRGLKTMDDIIDFDYERDKNNKKI